MFTYLANSFDMLIVKNSKQGFFVRTVIYCTSLQGFFLPFTNIICFHVCDINIDTTNLSGGCCDQYI